MAAAGPTGDASDIAGQLRRLGERLLREWRGSADAPWMADILERSATLHESDAARIRGLEAEAEGHAATVVRLTKFNSELASSRDRLAAIVTQIHRLIPCLWDAGAQPATAVDVAIPAALVQEIAAEVKGGG